MKNQTKNNFAVLAVQHKKKWKTPFFITVNL